MIRIILVTVFLVAFSILLGLVILYTTNLKQQLQEQINLKEQVLELYGECYYKMTTPKELIE